MTHRPFPGKTFALLASTLALAAGALTACSTPMSGGPAAPATATPGGEPFTYFQTAGGSCPRVFFEKDGAFGRDVPECPADSGLMVLPRNYPPRSLFIGFSQHPIHVDFMHQMIRTVGGHRLPVKVNILIPRYETEAAYNLLSQYLEEPYSEFVNFLSTPSDETLWTQDYFEAAVSMATGRASILDLPYTDREGELIPSSIALSCHMNLIAQPPFAHLPEEPGNGDYGGNIEAYPGDIIVIGDNMTTATRRTLQEHLRAQELIEIEVSWLETGHADELVSAVPAPAKGKGDDACSFAILRASPRLALDLLAGNDYTARGPGTGSIQPPLPEDVDMDAIEARTDFSRCFSALSKSGNAKTRGSKLCREFVRANEKYEQIISRAAERLMARIREKTGCTNMKTIDLPLLFAPEKVQAEYGLETDLAQAVNASTVNNISLGPLLVLPRQSYAPFQKKILEQFAPTGLDLVFIDGSYVHYLSGGIHCISNVIHSCRPRR